MTEKNAVTAARSAGELMETNGKSSIAAGNLSGFLEANREKIAQRCAKLIDPAKLTRICVQLVNDDKSGKLRACTQDSFLAALLDCLSCGLLPTHGRGQLIPYGSEVKFQIGYQGILELAARAGITAKPYLIFEEDQFDWVAGTDESITHKPNFRARRTPETLVGAYVVAAYPDGSKRFEVMTKDEIDAIRDRSKAANNGPWKTDYLEMAKKTVIRRASKYWPIKYDFDAAVEGDVENDAADAEFTDPEPGLAVFGSQPSAVASAGATAAQSLGSQCSAPSPSGGRTDSCDRVAGSLESPAPARGPGAKNRPPRLAESDAGAPESELFLWYANKINAAKDLNELGMLGEGIRTGFDASTPQRQSQRDRLRELYAAKQDELKQS